MKAGKKGDYNCGCAKAGLNSSSSCNDVATAWGGQVTWYSQMKTQPSVGIFASALAGAVTATPVDRSMSINLYLLKQSVEFAGGVWPTSLSSANEMVRYSSDQGVGPGEEGWFLRTTSGTGSTFLEHLFTSIGGGDDRNDDKNNSPRETFEMFYMKDQAQTTAYDEVLTSSKTLSTEFLIRVSLKTGATVSSGGIFMGGTTGGCGNL